MSAPEDHRHAATGVEHFRSLSATDRSLRVQQLTGLDAAFLAMETDNVFGHVASVIVLDPSTAPEPLTLERLTALIGRRLHLIPPFRRRLVTVPLGLDQPYWIEDPDFDLEYHVREIALPSRATTSSSPTRRRGCTRGRSTGAARCGSST
jgi:hypothetical protein